MAKPAASELITPVVLSGGSGTRLWPMSRTQFPKQLLPLVSADSLLVDTVRRTRAPALFGAPILVCNQEHRFIVAEQLRQAGLERRAIVLEPVGRNTAPAAAVAALIVARSAPEGLMLVAPSDHIVTDVAAFQRAVAAGVAAARGGALVTFGITPTRAETGYGYIRLDPGSGEPGDGARCVPVAAFVEKPDQAVAEGYLEDGGYVWNSGMFLFRADRYLAELERLHPAILEACRRALEGAETDLEFLRLNAAAFAGCPSESVDYAVMEKARNVMVVPAAMGWNDVGAWGALWEVGAKDGAGNVVIGDVLLEDVRNSYVRCEDGKLVAALGLDDVVLVVTDDAVLAASRARTQDVKRIVERLKLSNRTEADAHTTVYRPWGSYQSVDAGARFQVKRLVVKPGAKLSAQMHHHRAEHWVVVHGTAKVLRGEETVLLSENQSIYIPIGTVHRLENPGKVPLHLIEVQSGSYLGEDDIVRFQDDYGRG
ncbi:MAG TPA: mannose-1-phosphate guanylyltransferase/mannose-6-phosphate isomerase [Candidatus Sulfotelmatobacter sp.]|nr:mannose-1-phosphate guanylyltransferase/mannose-6-phosphate isomerase [Candidatus Sulfotelmatobacter sp.]